MSKLLDPHDDNVGAVNEMLLDEENQVNSGNAQQLVLPI